MKRFPIRLCALLACVVMLTSCLGNDDDNSSGYGDTAIISFTLGTLNRYTASVSTKTGNDTIIKTTVTGSTYKMTINQLSHDIFNPKELPVGTDVKHVVCTINTKNSGVVAIQSMTSDSLRWYSSNDSIDFSQPRVFRVISSDGLAYRDYTVTLNVSATTGVSFAWELAGTIDAGDITTKKLVARGDSISLTEADGTVGASAYEQYAFGDDGLLQSSRDNGQTWQAESLDDDSALLPADGKTACVNWAYAPADDTDYVLLVGTPRQDDETSMRVWRKIVPQAGGGQWVYMPFDDANHYPLPRQEWISMACYDGSVFAIGSDMVLRQSTDQGITWRQNSTYDLPASLTGDRVLMTTDKQERLWLLTSTGQLWRGFASK